MKDILIAFVHMFAMMAPWLVFGFLMAWIVAVWIPRSWVNRIMGASSGFGGILRAVAIGVPLPICSCPVLKAGQVFYATNTCPKGMCDAAWRTINQYVFALACGVREFYGGGWMKEPGKVITCCNDGLRPVYFKLEATDDEAGPFLGRD